MIVFSIGCANAIQCYYCANCPYPFNAKSSLVTVSTGGFGYCAVSIFVIYKLKLKQIIFIYRDKVLQLIQVLRTVEDLLHPVFVRHLDVHGELILLAVDKYMFVVVPMTFAIVANKSETPPLEQ